VFPGNIILDKGPVPPREWEWEIWGSEAPICSDATYCQIILALVRDVDVMVTCRCAIMMSESTAMSGALVVLCIA